MKNLKFKIITKYLKPYKKSFYWVLSTSNSQHFKRCNTVRSKKYN